MTLLRNLSVRKIAVAAFSTCSVIGVNSFDQPDVQDAKKEIRTLAGLEEYRQQGQFPEVSAFASIRV